LQNGRAKESEMGRKITPHCSCTRPHSGVAKFATENSQQHSQIPKKIPNANAEMLQLQKR